MIIELNKNYEQAENNSIMPKMYNGLTWETAKQEIQNGLNNYFEALIKEREQKLKEKNL